MPQKLTKKIQPISFDLDVHKYLRWLMSKGENASETVNLTMLRSAGFKKWKKNQNE
jgi:hypothetical protein